MLYVTVIPHTAEMSKIYQRDVATSIRYPYDGIMDISSGDCWVENYNIGVMLKY